MLPSQYTQLCSIACRIIDDVGEAQDIVQDAYLAAFLAGFNDFNALETRKWLVGTVRNKARMALRGTLRRRGRETQWQMEQVGALVDDPQDITQLLDTLAPAHKAVMALALSGHNRREIAYLLNLTDIALRQRISTLKRRIAEADITMPPDLPGLNSGVAYGRIRRALASKLFLKGGTLASHDPDGHLFVVHCSQNSSSRQ